MKNDYAAARASFILNQKGSVYGSWTGHLTAAKQLALFGHYLGHRQVVTGFTPAAETQAFKWVEAVS